jgi:uncharacterized protein YjbJ (UPF0337 family)
MKIGNVELEHVRGFGDKVFGLTKEVVGTVINNDRLVEEGEAQQAKAAESLKALRKQAEAEARETKASAFEAKQRAAQNAKERAS